MDYTKTAIKAQRSLRKAGQAMTLTRITPGAYNTATGTVESTSASFTGFGVALNYAQAAIDGTNILQGDQRVYLDPLLGATPQTGDTLTIGAEVWSVVTSRPLSPGGILVLNDVQIRRS